MEIQFQWSESLVHLLDCNLCSLDSQQCPHNHLTPLTPCRKRCGAAPGFLWWFCEFILCQEMVIYIRNKSHRSTCRTPEGPPSKLPSVTLRPKKIMSKISQSVTQTCAQLDFWSRYKKTRTNSVEKLTIESEPFEEVQPSATLPSGLN